VGGSDGGAFAALAGVGAGVCGRSWGLCEMPDELHDDGRA
jgi:hypothetical protein